MPLWDVVWWQHGSHSCEKHEHRKAGYYSQGQKLHQILTFHRERGMSIFTVEWCPRTWKIKITSTSPVQELSGFTRRTAALSSPDLFLALQGSDEILFISVHPEEETQLYWVPISYEALAQALRWWHVFGSPQCCAVVLFPSVSNEEAEAKLNAGYY